MLPSQKHPTHRHIKKEEAFELLKRSPNWIQPQIKVVSDEQSPVKFLSTDTLTITINGLSATIDLSNIGDDE